MNRRHFVMACTAAWLAALGACTTEDPNEKFIGYWQSQGGTKFPTLLHIARNGDSFLVTQAVWQALFTVGYKTKTVPATIDKSSNILTVGPGLKVAYEEATGQLLAGDKKASRITKEEYDQLLAAKPTK